jgi:hypothetical protein
MSCFILCDAHIDYLLSAAWVYRLNSDMDLDHVVDRVANMLETENAASVNFRYRENAHVLFAEAYKKCPTRKITITWTESRNVEPGTSFEGPTCWRDANAAILRIAKDAPEGGAYDKTGFTIEWADGEDYEGRIGVTRAMASLAAPLTKHVLDFNTASAGRQRPSHLTEERYREYLTAIEHHAPGSAAGHAQVIDSYQIGEAADRQVRTVKLIREVEPVQVLKAIKCYEHQSCDHPNWQESPSRRWCDDLRLAAIERLPGYDDAKWEIDGDSDAQANPRLP